MLDFITWTADPAIFTIGSREIRWYGLAFAIGFAIGYMIVERMWKKEGLPPAWIDSLLIYTMLGTVIGARLGHCLFYAPEYYLANPIEIFKIWEGGLASHGGTLGIIIAIYFYSKRVSHKSMLWAFDKLVVPTGLVAAMIRLGNLMRFTVIPLICLGDFVLSIIYTHGEWGRSLFLPLRAIRRNCMRPLVIW